MSSPSAIQAEKSKCSIVRAEDRIAFVSRPEACKSLMYEWKSFQKTSKSAIFRWTPRSSSSSRVASIAASQTSSQRWNDAMAR